MILSHFLISLLLQGGQATNIRHGANLPSTCDQYQQVFIKDGAGVYWCSATNTWTQLAGGSFGPTLDCSTSAGADFAAKVNACIAALPSTGGTADARSLQGTQSGSSTININKDNVMLLLGAVTMTSTATTGINVTGHRACIQGLGQGASVLRFNPSATGIMIKWGTGTGSAIVAGCIKGIGLDATGNTSQVKTGIQVTDAEELEISNVQWSSWHDTTHSSIGLEIKGRQAFDVHDLTNFSDEPFHIMIDPNVSSLTLDHAHFYNIYACDCVSSSAATDNPVWSIDSGVILTNNTWDGYQAWVGGSYGFYYQSSSEMTTGYNNTIANCRTEQSSNASGASIHFAPGNQVFNTTVRNCYLAASVNWVGLYARHINGLHIENNTYGVFGAALDLDSTVYANVDNNFLDFANGATVSITGANITTWCGNDINGSSFVTPVCSFGMANLSNQTNIVQIPNNDCFASVNASAVGRCLIKADLFGNVAIASEGSIPTIVGGSLEIGVPAGFSTSSLVTIPNSQVYAGRNAAGTNSVPIVGITGSDKVGIDGSAAGSTFGGDVTFFHPINLQGHANTSTLDTAGQVQLSGGGTFTYTFSTPYTTASLCVCSDATAPNAVRCASNTTTLVFQGTASDFISYICVGLPN